MLQLDPGEYVPDEPELAELHRSLHELRDKVYAHTDKDGGRSGSTTSTTPVPGVGTALGYTTEWLPLDRKWLPNAIELFSIQETRFVIEAHEIEATPNFK